MKLLLDQSTSRHLVDWLRDVSLGDQPVTTVGLDSDLRLPRRSTSASTLAVEFGPGLRPYDSVGADAGGSLERAHRSGSVRSEPPVDGPRVESEHDEALLQDRHLDTNRPGAQDGPIMRRSVWRRTEHGASRDIGRSPGRARVGSEDPDVRATWLVGSPDVEGDPRDDCD